MSFSKKFRNDPNLDENKKILRDFILDKKCTGKYKSGEIPTYEETDIAVSSDDEKDMKRQELFEYKYIFRFKQPDSKFIKRYIKMIEDSLRRIDNKRKKKHEEYLKEEPCQNELNLNENDAEYDFDPEKLDQKTKELLNDDYYAIREERCPKFPYDEDSDNEDWNHRIEPSKSDECGEEQLEKNASETSGVEIMNSKIYSKSQVKKQMIKSTQHRKDKG
ncbi:protein KRI1 homolog [Stegodyphus dumicola]|uniref:protein KRI1 homolog n=1 Tax=Stegodyphus dumicola TaxID=202533 RepID=UPI0015AE6257|nr:protein KRI1 homolog [Stegodyphus dumicola]